MRKIISWRITKLDHGYLYEALAQQDKQEVKEISSYETSEALLGKLKTELASTEARNNVRSIS